MKDAQPLSKSNDRSFEKGGCVFRLMNFKRKKRQAGEET